MKQDMRTKWTPFPKKFRGPVPKYYYLHHLPQKSKFSESKSNQQQYTLQHESARNRGEIPKNIC